MCWFMRGGLTISEMYQTESADRVIIADIIEKNLELTNKTKVPFV